MRIDTAELKRIGNLIITEADKIATELTSVRNTNADLEASWIDPTASKYFTAVTEQSNEMDKLPVLLKELGTALVNYAVKIEDFNAELASGIN